MCPGAQWLGPWGWSGSLRSASQRPVPLLSGEYDCMLRDLTRSRPRDTDAHLYLQHEKVHMKRYNHAREGIHHAKQKWYFCM
jgi:hypothetical protein